MQYGNFNNNSASRRQTFGGYQQGYQQGNRFRPMYDPSSEQFYPCGTTPAHPPSTLMPGSATAKPFEPVNSSTPVRDQGASENKLSLEGLYTSFLALQGEVFNLKRENHELKVETNRLNGHVSNLEQQLDELNQYGRRENVCFSNLKFSAELPVQKQVIDLCEEIGVTLTESDFVDVHPLPSRSKGGPRVIARFKERKMV